MPPSSTEQSQQESMSVNITFYNDNNITSEQQEILLRGHSICRLQLTPRSMKSMTIILKKTYKLINRFSYSIAIKHRFCMELNDTSCEELQRYFKDT